MRSNEMGSLSRRTFKLKLSQFAEHSWRNTRTTAAENLKTTFQNGNSKEHVRMCGGRLLKNT